MIIAKPWSKGRKRADRREWWREYTTENGDPRAIAIVVDPFGTGQTFEPYIQKDGQRELAHCLDSGYCLLASAQREADAAVRRRLGVLEAEVIPPPELRAEIVRLREKLSKLQARKRDLEERSSRLLMSANDIEEKQISRVRARLRDFGLDS